MCDDVDGTSIDDGDDGSTYGLFRLHMKSGRSFKHREDICYPRLPLTYALLAARLPLGINIVGTE